VKLWECAEASRGLDVTIVKKGALQEVYCNESQIFEAHCGRSLEVAVGYGMADKSEQIRSCVVTDDYSFEQGVQLNQ
jgi:hypothetical protein